MFDKVLLPIDMTHSESWEKAIPMALRCAGASGEVHVLGIVHDLGSSMIASYLPEDFEKHAMEKLKADLIDFAGKNFPDVGRVTVHVGYGHVPETILRTADHLGADLIVMASHPPNELMTLLVGSNADKVVRHAAIPVLVAR